MGASELGADRVPFKVANIITRFNSGSGGPPRTVALIGQAAVGHWRVELFTTDYLESGGDVLLTRDFPGHVNIMKASAQGAWGGLLMALRARTGYEVQLVHGARADVVHIHGMWAPFLTAFAWAARRHRIPYIVAPHGMLEPWSLNAHARRKSAALKTYQGAVLAGAAAIHATSEMEAENLRRLPWVRAPIYVVPNAVEPPGQPYRSNTRNPTRTVLFLSRLHEKKGLDILLRAWHQLRPPGWKLLLAGNGAPDYVRGLKRFCATEGVPRVEFLGHVDGVEREELLAGARVMVLPTYSENFGNVVAEALIRAVPVITTTGTPWSVIGTGRFGWYIKPQLSELIEALRQMAAMDDAELDLMGERGREYALSHLTTEVIRDGLRTMYLDIMQHQ